MQVRTDLAYNDPFFNWEIYNTHSDLSMSDYYLEVDNNPYDTRFNSRELIGDHSKNFNSKIDLNNIDPSLQEISKYLYESENFYRQNESNLTIENIQYIQSQSDIAFKNLEKINNTLVQFKETFPQVPEYICALREQKIIAYGSQLDRLAFNSKNLLKLKMII